MQCKRRLRKLADHHCLSPLLWPITCIRQRRPMISTLWQGKIRNKKFLMMMNIKILIWQNSIWAVSVSSRLVILLTRLLHSAEQWFVIRVFKSLIRRSIWRIIFTFHYIICIFGHSVVKLKHSRWLGPFCALGIEKFVNCLLLNMFKDWKGE